MHSIAGYIQFSRVQSHDLKFGHGNKPWAPPSNHTMWTSEAYFQVQHPNIKTEMHRKHGRHLFYPPLNQDKQNPINKSMNGPWFFHPGPQGAIPATRPPPSARVQLRPLLVDCWRPLYLAKAQLGTAELLPWRQKNRWENHRTCPLVMTNIANWKLTIWIGKSQ